MKEPSLDPEDYGYTEEIHDEDEDKIRNMDSQEAYYERFSKPMDMNAEVEHERAKADSDLRWSRHLEEKRRKAA